MPTAQTQPRWLIPTVAVLTVAGLVFLVLTIAVQAWLVAVEEVSARPVTGVIDQIMSEEQPTGHCIAFACHRWVKQLRGVARYTG